MTHHFQLKTDTRDNEVFIHLHGTFDGSSAFALLSVIAGETEEKRHFVINTDGLRRAYPFGKTVLEWHLPQGDLRTKLHFTGKFAHELVPAGCPLSQGRALPAHACGCSEECKNCTCRLTMSAAPKGGE